MKLRLLLTVSAALWGPLLGGVGAAGVAVVGFLGYLLNRGQTQGTTRKVRVDTLDTLERLVEENAQRIVSLQTEMLKQFNANIALERRVADLEAKLQLEAHDKVLVITERDAIKAELAKLCAEAEAAQISLRAELERAMAVVHEKEQQLLERTARIDELERRLNDLVAHSADAPPQTQA